MKPVLELADVEWQEVWTAEPMAQTVAPTAGTMLTVVRKAAPRARARQEIAGERMAEWEAN
jgi:hypothetical protein